MRKNETVKKPRVHRISKIAAEQSRFDKLSVAAGQSLSHPCFKADPVLSDEDLLRLIGESDRLGAELDKPSHGSDCKDSFTKMAMLGIVFYTRIAIRDWKFFSRLSGKLQHKKVTTAPHMTYYWILHFCNTHNCGDAENPCDGKALCVFLEKRKFSFTHDYDGDIPRTLRAMCSRMGVILARVSKDK